MDLYTPHVEVCDDPPTPISAGSKNGLSGYESADCLAFACPDSSCEGGT